MEEGYGIKESLEIINDLLQDEEIKNEVKKEKKFFKMVINAFLITKKFSFVKNHYISEAETVLSTLFKLL